MASAPRTLEDLERRYEDMLGFTPPKIAKRLKLSMTVDPDLVGALEDWRIAALTPDALDQKTVQLMCFAILLSQTSEAAANHARAAIKAGATLEELHASAGIATLFRGVAAFNMAGELLSNLFPAPDQAQTSTPVKD
ncbi:carboxymuconolactone decarboxylase family protein [Aquabacter spiritensis]|uniref:Alkylhydroperoxidase/carboxymuconolactone decarboxylase family protein YurZ n=1 Tax=Aquabacter spiritensis TaxID=933073 RepID=A0A4R3LR87_9HYPH|nr:carboxymuconolactone decarboxylase family protein [Aquabacter spiritensis]TCT02226.1 alkylhydroperoxidase/carboxymuconolactone decarboxylase family protein YurZ [Aquabacter spiritensis]